MLKFTCSGHFSSEKSTTQKTTKLAFPMLNRIFPIDKQGLDFDAEIHLL
jgi:hypothetical protein